MRPIVVRLVSTAMRNRRWREREEMAELRIPLEVIQHLSSSVLDLSSFLFLFLCVSVCLCVCVSVCLCVPVLVTESLISLS